MRRTGGHAFVVMLVAVIASACTQATGTAPAPAFTPRGATVVYAAIGASEGVGIGAANPLRDAWPQVFFRTALGPAAVFYNFSVPGVTVEDALRNEVPEAQSVRPTLVTIWLNVNDLIAGVSAPVFESELDGLVADMRRSGAAEVLVANTPYLDRLPAYLGCKSGNPPSGVRCPPILATIATADLDAAVDAYNAAIARVVQRHGAVLVDLHAQGEVPDAHPDFVGRDGFHPSTAGYAAIAAEFATAWKQAGGAAA